MVKVLKALEFPSCVANQRALRIRLMVISLAVSPESLRVARPRCKLSVEARQWRRCTEGKAVSSPRFIQSESHHYPAKFERMEAYADSCNLIWLYICIITFIYVIHISYIYTHIMNIIYIARVWYIYIYYVSYWHLSIWCLSKKEMCRSLITSYLFTEITMIGSATGTACRSQQWGLV